MRLARMIATQSNSKGIGPGAEMLKEQKLRAIQGMPIYCLEWSELQS